MIGRRLIAASALAIAIAGPARAEWLEASSEHFVVYGDSSERNVRRVSEQLERYHAALATVMAIHTEPPSKSNRVAVYAVGGDATVRRLYGGNNPNIAGFYVPRAGGSMAIIPNLRAASSSQLDFPTIILLHEYAHHFSISASAYPLPRWAGEGFAEFAASASFGADGGVTIGRPANHRAGELFHAPDVTVTDLLDPEAYEKRKPVSYDAFYGKSWLLYHYLVFEPSRQGQLTRYLAELVAGKSQRAAGEAAFGDLGQLEKDVDGYLKRNRFQAAQIAADKLKIGPISVRQLRPGEVAVLPLAVQSKIGVSREQATELLPKVRAVAQRFPDDPAVLAALAEAEHDAGNNAEAIAAADRAIAKDPATVNAYVQKGYALIDVAQDSGDNATYAKARSAFLALNRIENDHPLPLAYNYRIIRMQGREPPVSAQQGLERAAVVAPFALDLRMELARELLRRGEAKRAQRLLAAVAYSPHGGPLAEEARVMIARIDIDPAWRGEREPGAFDVKPPSPDE